MNQRLQQFLTAENLTQSQLADSLGVARASVSHIIAGRNKPGFEFIESLCKAYPNISAEWLITGKGKMYKQTDNQDISTNPAASVPPTVPTPRPDDPDDDNIFYEGYETANLADKAQIEPKSAPLEPKAPVIPKIIERSPDGSYSRPAATPAMTAKVSRIVLLFEDGTFQELSK